MRALYPIFLATLLLSICPASHADTPALTGKVLLGGKLSMLLPNDFQPMSQEQLLKKFSRPNPPSLVYANEPANVSIAMDHTAFRATLAQIQSDGGIEDMKRGMLQGAPGMTFLRSEFTKINGRAFIFIDARAPTVDGEVRNLMAITSLEDRLLVVSFNCTRELEAEWLATGNKIIQSIAIK